MPFSGPKRVVCKPSELNFTFGQKFAHCMQFICFIWAADCRIELNFVPAAPTILSTEINRRLSLSGSKFNYRKIGTIFCCKTRCTLYFSHVSEFAIEFEHCKKIAKKGVNMKTKQKKKRKCWMELFPVHWLANICYICLSWKRKRYLRSPETHDNCGKINVPSEAHDY